MSQLVPMDVMIRSLDAAVVETLETMFFADALAARDAELPAGGISSVVRFGGDASGLLELRMSDLKARELAASFLGLDPPEVDRTQTESVCGEMANMICGAMVSIASPEGRFALSPPEILGPGEAVPVCSVTRLYEMDSEWLEVSLDCSLPACAGEC